MPEQIEMALTGLCSQDWEGVWEERMSLAINLKPRKYLSRGFPLYLPLPCLLIQLLLLLILTGFQLVKYYSGKQVVIGCLKYVSI